MKGCNIKISIITINLNNVKGLIKTVNSILIQDNADNIEWIFIDGQSSDYSLEYVKNMDLPFEHKLIYEKDNGIYYAMNKGIKVSTGSLLIFLNSGDTFIHKNCLQLIFDAYAKYDSDLMLFGFNYKMKLKLPRPLIWRFWGMPTSHQAMVYKRNLLIYNQYNTIYKLASDYDNFLQIYSLTKKITRINEFLIINENYGSNEKFSLLKEEYKHILIKHTNTFFGSIINFFKFFYLNLILK